jgi:hypothetical protein
MTVTVAPFEGAGSILAMETVYRVVLGFQQFGIHSYFQQLCLGNYADVDIAKNFVEVLNGDCPGDYRIVHTDGFFSGTLRSPGNCLGLSTLN